MLRLETRNLPPFAGELQADQIVCPTNGNASNFRFMVEMNIRVIFDGVDQDFFRPQTIINPLILGSA